MSSSNRHFLSLLPLFAVLSISPMELSSTAPSRGIAAEDPKPNTVKLIVPETKFNRPEKLAPIDLSKREGPVEPLAPKSVKLETDQKREGPVEPLEPKAVKLEVEQKRVAQEIDQLEYRVAKLKIEQTRLPETVKATGEDKRIAEEVQLLETRVVKLQLQESKLPEVKTIKLTPVEKKTAEEIEKLETRVAKLKIEEEKLPDTLVPTEKEKRIVEVIELLESRIVKLKLEESKIPEPQLVKLETEVGRTSEEIEELEARIAKLKLESDKGVPALVAKLPDVQVKAAEVCDLEEKNKVLTKQVDELMSQQKSIIESLFNMNAMMAQYIRGQQQPQQPVNQPLSYQQIYPTLSSASAGSWVFFPQGSQALPQQQPQLAQPQVQYAQPQYPQQQPIVQQQPYSTFGQPQVYSPIPSQYDVRYNQPLPAVPGNFGSSPFTYNFGSNNTFNWMS